MARRIRDITPLLEEATREAKAAGFERAALELERACSGPFTTSSELLMEHGIAIRRFLADAQGLPRPVRAKFKACLNETELAASGFRQLFAMLRRSPLLGN